jgi:hypothetical protein
MRAWTEIIRGAWSRSDSPAQAFKASAVKVLEVYGVVGLWKGEASLVGGMTSRPIVSSLLAAHFRRRLSLLRRWVSLGNRADDDADETLEEIDAALANWRARRSIGGAVTFLLSVLGTVGGLISVAHGVRDIPLWGWLVLGLGIFVLYLFVVGSFVVKRGLMLGGSAASSHNPASIDGNGLYGLERAVFDPIRIKRRELPFDLVLANLYVLLFAGFAFALAPWWVGALLLLPVAANVFAYGRRLQLRRL